MFIPSAVNLNPEPTMDATYSLRQSAQHPDLWLVDEHFGQHVEPLCGWTTKAKAEALQAKLNAAAARRAAL